MDVITRNSPALHCQCGQGMGLTSYLVPEKNKQTKKRTFCKNKHTNQTNSHYKMNVPFVSFIFLNLVLVSWWVKTELHG